MLHVYDYLCLLHWQQQLTVCTDILIHSNNKIAEFIIKKQKHNTNDTNFTDKDEAQIPKSREHKHTILSRPMPIFLLSDTQSPTVIIIHMRLWALIVAAVSLF